MSCAGQIAIAAIKAIGAGAMTTATAATAGVVAIEVSGVRVKYQARPCQQCSGTYPDTILWHVYH